MTKHWRKSTQCGGSGTCVEMGSWRVSCGASGTCVEVGASRDHTIIGIRDSTDKDGPQLHLTPLQAATLFDVIKAL